MSRADQAFASALAADRRVRELEGLRTALALGAAQAAAQNLAVIPDGSRVRAHFPFAAHQSLGTVRGGPLPVGETTGYIVELDDPIPGGWRPNGAPFVPHQNVEPLK